MDRNERDRGVTLVELLVVVVILATLAGVVAFSVSGISDTGQTAACRTEASIVRTAEEAFRANDPSHVYGSVTSLKPKYLGTAPAQVTITLSAAVTGPPVIPAGATYSLAWTTGSACASVTPAIAP